MIKEGAVVVDVGIAVVAIFEKIGFYNLQGCRTLLKSQKNVRLSPQFRVVLVQ